jgi:hypothetical protein
MEWCVQSFTICGVMVFVCVRAIVHAAVLFPVKVK